MSALQTPAVLLAVDLGNTKVRFGFYQAGVKIADLSVSARTHRLADEYVLLLEEFCSRQGIDRVEGSILASVVPSLTPILTAALERCTGRAPMLVGHGIRTGLDIRTDYQAELGADIVANAVGARAKLEPPFAVIDLGTATTISLVDRADRFQGVAILPGLSASARALAESCAGLPEISIAPPRALLCKNPADSLAGGLVYGFASMVDGMIGRIQREYGLDQLALIACGGSAGKVIPHCTEQITLDPDLTLDGLCRLWELNKKRK